MKLTVNTDMGGFEFNLSQASIIYLLGLAQQIEDEGEPKQAKEQQKKSNVRPGTFVTVVKTKLPEPDADSVLVEGETESELIQKAEETVMPEEWPVIDQILNPPMGKSEPEDDEDFQTLLDKAFHSDTEEERPKRATFAPADGKYKGFLMIRCEQCGTVRGFNAKEPIDEYKCRDCYGKTKLKDLRRMFMDCECGRHYKYYTNETAEVITHNCITCGSPVDMMLNSRRTAYISIGGGTARKHRSGNRISTGKFNW